MAPIGLKVIYCPIHVLHGKAWAPLRSKPQIDEDGRHKSDVNGRPTYLPVIESRGRALADRFSSALMGLVQREYRAELEGAL
jgi:hypothetical protein